MNIYRRKIKWMSLLAAGQLFFLQLLCQQVKRPPLTGIAFVELQVSDTKKAIIFYEALMGYSLNNGIIRVNHRQFIKIKDGLPPAQDERLLCLGFQTTDAEAFRLYLQSRNIVVPPAVQKEPGGSVSFTVTDPDKHAVTFVQYANAKGQPPDMLNDKSISKRILHAGLTISDTAAAGAFYRDILGFSEIWRGGANDSVTSWINMRVPEGTDYLEYMIVKGTVSRQQLGGLHHIALMVPDMQQAVDVLSVRAAIFGYPVASPRIGRNNRWQLNLFDPDGTRIELMEPFTMR